MTACINGHFYDDNFALCPRCVTESFDKGLREIQPEFVRKVLRREMGYTLRVTKTFDRHVLLFTTDTRTFCGRDLTPTVLPGEKPKKARKPELHYWDYTEETLRQICPLCRSELRDIVAEVVE